MPDNRIVDAYDEARRLVRRREHRELTPKEFLDTVAPGKRNEKSARDYIRRLRSGERTGTVLAKRAQRDSGRTVRVDYKVGEFVDPNTGEIQDDIRSQNVVIPESKSRLDWYRLDWKKSVNSGLRKSYSRRKTAWDDLPQDKKDRYKTLRKLPPGARVASVTRVSKTHVPAVVLRG